MEILIVSVDHDREKLFKVETLEAGQIQFAGLLSGIWNV